MDWALYFIYCWKFEITDAKLHVPIVILSIKDNVELTKQLSNVLKKSVYWKNYQSIPVKVINQGTNIYELLSASFPGVKRYFVFTYAVAANAANNETGIKDRKSNFFREEGLKIIMYWLDWRNFYDQIINDLIKQYDEVRKVSTGQVDDYTTESLLDYAYFKDNNRIVAVDLSKKRALDADPRAIQQTVFQKIAGGADNTTLSLYTVLETSKETAL